MDPLADQLTRQALARLVLDLHVRRLELEVQNEELRRIQLNGQETSDRYQALYEQAPVAYVSIDARGLVLEVNRPGEALLGRTLHDLKGRHLSALMSEADADRFHLYLRALFAPGSGPQTAELSLARPGGERIDVMLAASAPRDGIACAALLDVTELRRQEAARRQQEVAALASGAAHEFNNVLMGVAGAVQQALRDLEPGHPARAHVERALHAVMLGAGASRRLSVAGHPANPTTPPPVLAAPGAEPSPLPALDVLVVDDDDLVRAAVEANLRSLGHRPKAATSAIEALALLEGGLTVDLLVTDVMMPGMLGTELARAAERRHPGLRALFMSANDRQDLIRRAGLPPEAVLVQKPFAEEALERALRAALNPRRVLVVDDSVVVADMLADVFRDAGARVLVAYDYPSAVARAAELGPDVVVCDLDLGNGSTGYDLAKVLRRQATTAAAHLVAITGSHPDECRTRAAVVGFDALVTKPLDVQVLLALVARGRVGRALLARSGA